MLLKSLQFFAIIALVAVAFIDPALASMDGPFSTAQEKGLETFENVRTIVFIVGGFGLVGLAFAAIFGKINWKWFAALAVGLFVLAVAGAVIDYATDSGVGSELNDTIN